jgi:hypothetical protein
MEEKAMAEKKWQTYEDVAQYLLNQFAEKPTGSGNATFSSPAFASYAARGSSATGVAEAQFRP